MFTWEIPCYISYCLSLQSIYLSISIEFEWNTSRDVAATTFLSKDLDDFLKCYAVSQVRQTERILNLWVFWPILASKGIFAVIKISL